MFQNLKLVQIVLLDRLQTIYRTHALHEMHQQLAVYVLQMNIYKNMITQVQANYDEWHVQRDIFLQSAQILCIIEKSDLWKGRLQAVEHEHEILPMEK